MKTKKKTKSCQYEIFLSNGSSFILDDVDNLSTTIGEDRTIESLHISGSNIKDKLEYLNIKQIVCIIKRSEKENKSIWNKLKI